MRELRTGETLNPYRSVDGSPLECYDAIKAAMGIEGFKAFCRGCIFKYIWRYDKKGFPLSDLYKARNYLEKLIELIKDKECANKAKD